MCLVCWKGGKISSIFQAYFLSSAVAIHHLTMNDSHRHDQLSSEASTVLSLWLSISGFAAVTGNIVVLWLFYKNEPLRRISNRFLASLSVADLLVGLVIAPTWIIFIWWFTFHSVFLECLWVHTTTATTYNICCISVDRFIAIWFPFRYQEIVTKTRCYTVIILVWLFSLGLPFSTLPVRDKENFNIVMLWISLAFITFVIPLLVISCFYILIFKSAKKQFYRILAGESPITYNDNFRVRSMKNFKAIKTIGFVLGACIITWMPSLVYLFVDFYYTVINDWIKVGDYIMLCGLGLRYSLLLHQRSIHFYIAFEIKSSAKPFAEPFVGFPADTAQETPGWNQVETWWYEMVLKDLEIERLGRQSSEDILKETGLCHW